MTLAFLSLWKYYKNTHWLFSSGRDC